jgi:hypothetical protein
MTLNEHVYAIRNLMSKGVSTNDAHFSLRLIAHFLNAARAILTERKADKYVYISEQTFQSLCLDLELSSFHNCCTLPAQKCKVLRSKIKIPKFLNAR